MIMTNKITDERGSGGNVQKRASNDARFCAHALRQMLSAIGGALATTPAPAVPAAFTDCETQTVVHCDRVDQGNNHFDVAVARHYHLSTPSGSSMVPVTSVVR